MPDIFFKTANHVFSYRVAGILIRDGKVLLQKPVDDVGYAFPGGHVEFGETNEDTLVREFREEISADIRVDGLRWVGELFFPWADKVCHQICLYYDISLKDETQIPFDRSFFATDEHDSRVFDLEFSWVSIGEIGDVEVYPANARELLRELLKDPCSGVRHFVYRQGGGS